MGGAPAERKRAIDGLLRKAWRLTEPAKGKQVGRDMIAREYDNHYDMIAREYDNQYDNVNARNVSR